MSMCAHSEMTAIVEFTNYELDGVTVVLVGGLRCEHCKSVFKFLGPKTIVPNAPAVAQDGMRIILPIVEERPRLAS